MARPTTTSAIAAIRRNNRATSRPAATVSIQVAPRPYRVTAATNSTPCRAPTTAATRRNRCIAVPIPPASEPMILLTTGSLEPHNKTENQMERERL